MLRIVLLIFYTISICAHGHTQVLETKNWCLSKCDLAGDERENTKLIFMRARNAAIKNSIGFRSELRFPLRIGIVQQDSTDIHLKESKVRTALSRLNEAFKPAGIIFYIDRVDVILSTLYMDDLPTDNYVRYNEFSDRYDLPDMISLYVFENQADFCVQTDLSIRCNKIGGFSYILSDRTSNIVMSKFDLDDQKIVAHEFGHFFGLYHTFEEVQFGKDNFKPGDCEVKGDCLCDTPPDPSPIYDVYVNYSNCEMIGYTTDDGHVYKPDIRNYMAYYKPCYLKTYQFSPQQINVMKTAAMSDFRKKFRR